MANHFINESQEEKLNHLADIEDSNVDIIIQKAIDEYYMNHYETNEMNVLQQIKQINEKQLIYLQSLAILTKNYEGFKEVNDSINDFINN